MERFEEEDGPIILGARISDENTQEERPVGSDWMRER